MANAAEDVQVIQAKSTLLEFIKILVKEYPLVFENGSGRITLDPSEECSYEVNLEIKSNQKK